MTILRSRAVAGQAVALANAGVDRALKEWEDRVALAREAGRQQGLAEAAAQVAEAERRAAQAEAAAAARMADRQAEFLARFEPVLASLGGATRQLGQLEKQLVQESEAEIVRLALAVAAAVLRCTVERDPAWMTSLARHAISEVPDRRALVVRMHPVDAAALSARMAEVTARIPGLEGVEVLGDASLAHGSCIVQSQGTRLDAGIPSCWERLAQRLLDAAPSSDCAVIARPGDRPAAPADEGAP
jgi:flagellar biosynthesis/type III secretory pathway protein FliH